MKTRFSRLSRALVAHSDAFSARHTILYFAALVAVVFFW